MEILLFCNKNSVRALMKEIKSHIGYNTALTSSHSHVAYEGYELLKSRGQSFAVTLLAAASGAVPS